MSNLIDELLAKTSEEEANKELEKFAEEVYQKGLIDGITATLEKLAADLVTPGDSPAGNQVAMTIQKALELSAGGDPQLQDTGEEAKEESGAEKEAEEKSLLAVLLQKLAEGEAPDEPTAEEKQHDAEVAAAAQSAHADLMKPEQKAALTDMVKKALAQMG